MPVSSPLLPQMGITITHYFPFSPIHKHGKHIKTINTVIESCLIVILIVLVAIMMVLRGKLQGTARVINYTGLVRGATQREVQLEITGNPND